MQTGARRGAGSGCAGIRKALPLPAQDEEDRGTLQPVRLIDKRVVSTGQAYRSCVSNVYDRKEGKFMNGKYYINR